VIGEAVKLDKLFAGQGGGPGSLQGTTFRRSKVALTSNVEVITDCFDGSGAECSFLRFRTDISSSLTIATAGDYSVYTPRAGGWLLKSGDPAADAVAGTLERFDIFAGIKSTRFPGSHALRKPLVALGVLYHQIRDRL